MPEAKTSDQSPANQPKPQHRKAGRQPTRMVPWLIFNIAIPLALLALGGLAILMFGKREPESRPDPDTSRSGILKSLPPVRVVQIKALDLSKHPLHLEVDGVVVPFKEVQIAAEVAGRITKKTALCQSGANVKKGDLLMEIDETNYKLDVERLQSQQEQAYEQINELRQEIANVRKQADLGAADVKLQQAEVDRQTNLPKGFSSRKDIDAANRSLLQARQQKVGYENQIQLLTKRLKTLAAAEKLAATQLKIAKEDLKRTEVRAPMTGVIVSEQVEEDSFVNRGSPLVMIEDTEKVEVVANLRMDQLYWVMDQLDGGVDLQKASDTGVYELPPTSATVEYELTGRGKTVYRWSGNLAGFNGIGLDANTRTVPVRIVVDNPRQYVDESGKVRKATGPTALVRGMYVRVKLNIKPKTPLVVVPALAMKPGNRVWQFVPDNSVLDKPAKDTNSGKSSAEEAPPSSEADATPTSAAKEPKDSSVDQKNAKADANRKGTGEENDQDSESDEIPFDPAEWQAGKVVVRDAIVPVDSLSTNVKVDTENPIADDLEKRNWVCEVRDGTIVDGSFVVTSPLASVGDGTIPARAETKVVGQLMEESSMSEQVATATPADSNANAEAKQ